MSLNDMSEEWGISAKIIESMDIVMKIMGVKDD